MTLIKSQLNRDRDVVMETGHRQNGTVDIAWFEESNDMQMTQWRRTGKKTEQDLARISSAQDKRVRKQAKRAADIAKDIRRKLEK